MLLIAVSGGPDSMYLLNKYKRRKNIYVVHVNYNLRKKSIYDQKIVEHFCQKFNIKYKIKNITTKPQGNLENWARNIRYNFFSEVYKNIGAKKILIAHHKDDFLETALMQFLSGRTPEYYGIRKKIHIFNMLVERPLINKLWKKEIEYYLKRHNLSFAIDSSNQDLNFTRNKIRKIISKMSIEEKEEKYKWFVLTNKILQKKAQKVQRIYVQWKNDNYSLSFFKEITNYQNEVLFKFLVNTIPSIKISQNKIESIIKYIQSQKNDKDYKLNEQWFLRKRQKKLYLISFNSTNKNK